jgi:VWFA-related protein
MRRQFRLPILIFTIAVMSILLMAASSPADAITLLITTTPSPVVSPTAAATPSISVSTVKTVEVSQVDNSQYPEVTVYARVLDAAGSKVNGLAQSQFSLTEDGKPVDLIGFSSVNETAITTLLVIDHSGSMSSGNKMSGAKNAALTFVGLMRSQDKTGLIVFDHRISLLQDFTSDQTVLRSKISAISIDGGTSWYDALIDAIERVKPVTGRKSVILLTDGIDEDSRNSFDQALSVARKSETPLYTIGLGSFGSYDPDKLRQIAQAANGKFYASPSAAELADLYRTLSQATQDEYVLRYKSPRPSFDGTRRGLEIKVGDVGGVGNYAETHLLHIESNLWVGFGFCGALLLILFLPLTVQFILRRRAATPRVMPLSAPPPIEDYPLLCPHCGRPVRAGVRFCGACGKSLVASPSPPAPVASNVCPRCGNMLHTGVKFCAKCGTKL